jgi:omega-6 fatty acid desaturase (delta-12 desaturase)
MLLNDAAPASVAPSNDAEGVARDWMRVLMRYREPSLARSLFELAITLVPLVVLWVAMWWALSLSFWVSLALAIPASGFLVRLFMIQHDCGHGSFFRSKWLNDWIGRALSVLTLTPYDFWRRAHSIHHATSGNLDRRGLGDIDTLTVREYLALPRLRRVAYRLYRHPLVMFGVGPAYLFLLRHRVPAGLMREGAGLWLSTMATNAAIALIVVALMWLVGVGPFLLVHLPMTLLGASIGVWLFYVQHQFEDTKWAESRVWNLPDAALHGSSYYDLPPVLRWFTANIGVHHVHHLNSRIPFYRLRQVLRDNPELGAIGRLTLWQSLKCVQLAVWDEDRQRLISFREMKRRLASPSRCVPSRSAAAEAAASAAAALTPPPQVEPA